MDLGVSEGQQNLYENCIHDFWMRFDEFSKGKEELLDHWIRPSFNLMSCLRPKHLFWFSNLRMKSQKLINWMIYMKSHLSDFTTDHNQQFQIKVRVTETWKYIAKTGQNFNKYIHHLIIKLRYKIYTFLHETCDTISDKNDDSEYVFLFLNWF